MAGGGIIVTCVRSRCSVLSSSPAAEVVHASAVLFGGFERAERLSFAGMRLSLDLISIHIRFGRPARIPR